MRGLSAIRARLGRRKVSAPANWPEPRWGGERPSNGAIEQLLAAHHDVYLESLETIGRHAEGLRRIASQTDDATLARWENPLFTGMAAASLYAFLLDRKPARYVEVGSGNSTLFAAAAKRDGELDTEIVSIDPEPRREIDSVCDRVIRMPLEDAAPDAYRDVRSGDVVLIDGSHIARANSDVTVFFLEVLPALPADVLVGIHDIFLPDDYPPTMCRWGFNEQYLVGALLLGHRYRPVLPCYYVANTPALATAARAMLDDNGLTHVATWGSALWLRTP